VDHGLLQNTYLLAYPLSRFVPRLVLSPFSPFLLISISLSLSLSPSLFLFLFLTPSSVVITLERMYARGLYAARARVESHVKLENVVALLLSYCPSLSRLRPHMDALVLSSKIPIDNVTVHESLMNRDETLTLLITILRDGRPRKYIEIYCI